jgi:membrane associated rhomboid family serine protease
MSGDWQPEAPWFAKGAGNSTAILHHGEFFRLVTSLTLHADLVHLLGNCFLGIFLLHFFLQLTGNGLGLAAMLVTAVTANYLNVLVHGLGHMFVGFSTALFAIIGMLCTMSFAFKTWPFSPCLAVKVSEPTSAATSLVSAAASLAAIWSAYHSFPLFVPHCRCRPCSAPLFLRSFTAAGGWLSPGKPWTSRYRAE